MTGLLTAIEPGAHLLDQLYQFLAVDIDLLDQCEGNLWRRFNGIVSK